MKGMSRWTIWPTMAALGLLSGCGYVAETPSAERPDEEAYVRVSPRDHRYFELSNGSPYIPIGLNIAFPRFLYDEDAVLNQMETRLQNLSANGGNYIQIWMGHPFYDVEHSRSGRYDSIKVRRIDAVLALARKYGVRVKMTFEHFRTLSESPPLYAGDAPLGKPIHHVTNGGPAKDMSEFFTLPGSKNRFKRKLAWFAKRYSEEPAVFAWQLWSGIDRTEGLGWEEWTAGMLEYAHQQFPNHMAVQSLGAIDVYRRLLLFRPVWRLPANDFIQVRRYLDEGANLEICKGPMDVMLADAVQSGLSADAAKPVVIDESGAVEPDHSTPSKLYERDRLGTILHDVLFTPFFTGAAGAGQIWHWNVYVERNDLWRHFRRFADVVDGIDPPLEGFQPSMLPHGRMRVYVLRGTKTVLIWCRDSQAGWREELTEMGVPAVKGATLDFNTLDGGPPRGAVRLYNPWTGEWTEGRLTGGKLELPDFFRSYVVRVDS